MQGLTVLVNLLPEEIVVIDYSFSTNVNSAPQKIILHSIKCRRPLNDL